MKTHEESFPFAIVFWNYTLMEGIGLVHWSGEGFFWSFRGAIINGQQFGTITSVDNRRGEIPHSFQLHQNYPNPFNGETTITFGLKKSGFVKLRIYNLQGKEVITLSNKELPAGKHRVAWHGRDNTGTQVASGIYFYRLSVNGFRAVRKLVFIR